MKTTEQRERHRIYMANRRANSPELRERNREYSRKYQKDHRRERNAYAKKYRLRRDYGMTWGTFNAMLAEQNGMCAICGVFMDPPARCAKDSISVTVDHCHQTGRVRGLLCYSCNLGLGIFKDSLTRVQRAAAYLEKFEASERARAQKENPPPHPA